MLLCLLGMAMNTSAFAANFCWVMLFANWLAEWNWRDKFRSFKTNYLLHAFIVLFVVHLVGLLYSANLGYAMHDLQVKLPLMALPLVLLTTPSLNQRERRWVCGLFCATVVVVSLGCFLFRYLPDPQLPHRSIVPFVSHIRFSLSACLVVCLAVNSVWNAWRRRSSTRRMLTLLSLPIVAWLIYFMLLLQSYTGLAVLLLLLLFGVVRGLRSSLASRWRWGIAACFLIGIGLLGWRVAAIVADYYRPAPVEQGVLVQFTANGNPYTHADNDLIENGAHPFNYYCEQELRTEWDKRSSLSFDGVAANGQPISHTLVRYLNSMGLTKDSAGMAAMSEADVAAVERGVANRVYVDGSMLRRMVYRLLYEYDNYRLFNYLQDSSMGQRWLLWQNGWQVFLQHPLIGVGTGDVVELCHQRLCQTGSPLAGTAMHLHNQYLTLLVAFGVVGFTLIVGFFVRAWWHGGRRLTTLAVAYLIIVLTSCLTEDTLETLAGILLCTFPMVFLSPTNEDKQ